MNKKNNTAKVTHWQAHLQAWKESGLSQAGYCKKHNLIYSKFGYWQRKLGSHRAGFTPVVQRTPVRHEVLSIRLPNGIEIHGVDAHNFSVATDLLEQCT